MVAFLSQDWLDLYLTLATDLPPRPGVSGVLQVVVSGSPDGEVTYAQRVEDGRIVEVTLGPVDEPDVVLTQTYADAVAIARGHLDLAAGFMQGRVKMVGATGALMTLLPLTQREHYRAILEKAAEKTTF